jgi:hypothetical protein
MTRTSVLVSTLLAVSLLPAASLAQSRTEPPGVAQAIENQCDGEQWYIVSQDPETNRIVFRCEPPPRE